MNRKIANGWERKKLGDVVTTKTGRRDANEGNINGKYLFFTCAAEPIRSNTYSFEGPAIILPGNGANVGLVMYFNDKFEAYQRTYVLTDFKGNLKYIYYVLKSQWKQYNDNKQYGSATNYIKIENILDFPIVIPPIKIQDEIVLLCEKAEHVIGKRKTADLLMDQYLQSVFIEMFGDPIDNPKEWDVKDLGNCLDIPLNSGWSPVCSDDSTGIPVLSLANLTDTGLTADIKKYYSGLSPKKGHDLKKGDILISRSNTPELVGRSGLYSGSPENVIYPDLMIRIRADLRIIEPNYLIAYLHSHAVMELIRRMAKGSSASMVKISQGSLLKLQIIVPPIELQMKFMKIAQNTYHLRGRQKLVSENLFLMFNSTLHEKFGV